jgi:DNA (cytosine-5)-methyltransferase 1
MNEKRLAFIDLFAGIGGLRMGFEDADARCVFSSEIDKYAQQTYAANFGDTPYGDITTIEPCDIPAHDVLLAGFPCQPFSKIGKREGFGHGTQGTLFFDIVRILEHHQPSAFLLENVTGILTNDDGNTLTTILDTLNLLGYSVSHTVLNSADFGLAQNRRRVYFVGFRASLGIPFTFPQGTQSNIYMKDILEGDVSGYSISRHLQEVYLFKKDDGKPQIVDKTSAIHGNTLVASYHKIQRITGTFVRGGETGLRLLSKAECLALQGFPPDFMMPVSRTQMYRQLGNSVAIPVVRAISDSIKNILRGTNIDDQKIQRRA